MEKGDLQDKYKLSFSELQKELFELRRTFERLQIRSHPAELLVSILYYSLVGAINNAEDIISFLEKDKVMVKNKDLFPEWYQEYVWRYFRLLESLRVSFDFVIHLSEFMEYVSEDKIADLKNRLYDLLKKSKIFAFRISKESPIFRPLRRI